MTEVGATGAVSTTTLYVSTTTLYQAASSTAVAAAAMPRRIEQNRLAWTHLCNASLTNWKVPGTSFTAAERVTPRRIVSHCTGFGVYGFPGYARGATVPTVS